MRQSLFVDLGYVRLVGIRAASLIWGYKWQMKRNRLIRMKSKTKPTTPTKDQFKTGYIDREPPQKDTLPTGPFRQAGEEPQSSLLIFEPRSAISALINDLTGGYGYSHLAVDCGELDIPTGKRVMVESTVGVGVHKSFQDEYGDRKFVRIPLEKAEINAREFCDCIHSKLGEKFDDEEILTLGILHNPAQQICSDLATVCLPETVRTNIARYYRAGFLHPLSAASIQRRANKPFYLFVSPNSFAEYFGAPRGKKLIGPDQLSEPVLPSKRIPPMRAALKIISMFFRNLGRTNQ